MPRRGGQGRSRPGDTLDQEVRWGRGQAGRGGGTWDRPKEGRPAGSGGTACTYQAVPREHLQEGDEVVAVPEVFIQVADVPLGLEAQEGGRAAGLQSHPRALGGRVGTDPGGQEAGGAPEHTSPREIPTSALQCYRETGRGEEEEEERDRRQEAAQRRTKSTERAGFRGEGGAPWRPGTAASRRVAEGAAPALGLEGQGHPPSPAPTRAPTNLNEVLVDPLGEGFLLHTVPLIWRKQGQVTWSLAEAPGALRR